MADFILTELSKSLPEVIVNLVNKYLGCRASATATELRVASQDKSKIWQRTFKNVFGINVVYLYNSWDAFISDKVYQNDKIGGFFILAAGLSGKDDNDGESEPEDHSIENSDHFILVYLRKNKQFRQVNIKIVKDACHDAAIKAFLRRNWNRHFTINDVRSVSVQRIVQRWRKRFGGDSSAQVNRKISKILDIPPENPVTTKQLIQETEAVVGHSSDKEVKLIKRVSTPLIQQLVNDAEFMKSVFSDPKISEQLGTTNLAPLEMKDGTIILINPDAEKRTPAEVIKDYNTAVKEITGSEKPTAKKSLLGRVYSGVKRGVKYVASLVSSTLTYLKHGIVTVFNYLYDNLTIVTWIIQTLTMIKRAVCSVVSESFKITIFKPSGVTWFYKLKKWWNNWVVQPSFVLWPGIKGLFFTLAPDMLTKLNGIIDQLPTDQEIEEKTGVKLNVSTEDNLKALSDTTTSFLATSSVESIGLLLGIPPGTASSVLSLLKKAGPIIKSIGPYLIKSFEALSTAGSLKELLMDKCISMKVDITDEIRKATHSMSLACRGENQEPPCVSRKNRVIRFTPFPEYLSGTGNFAQGTWMDQLIRKAQPYLFPGNIGVIDVSVEELLESMQLPAEFIDTELESIELLESEFRVKKMDVLSDAAYEAYFTLTKMIEMYATSGDRFPETVVKGIQLLRDLDEALTSGKVTWSFRKEWNDKFDVLTKEVKKNERKRTTSKRSSKQSSKRSSKRVVSKKEVQSLNTAQVQQFFAQVRIALVHEEESHGNTSPKAKYLSELYEVLQNIMTSYKIELIPKQLLDAAQEAIERNIAGNVAGNYCLIGDSDILILLAPFVNQNIAVKTTHDQLQTVIDNNKSVFTWCVKDEPEIDISIYIESKTLLNEMENTSLLCTDVVRNLMKRIEPYRNWIMYDNFYKKFEKICKKDGGQGLSDCGQKQGQRRQSHWIPLSHTRFAFEFPFE